MAKIPKGILGAVSGLVGTVVGAVVRGVATIRSRPKKSTKPAVQSQINQRSKFGLATGFMSRLVDVLNVGFQSYASTMSPTNAAVQLVLKDAVTGVSPDYALNFAKILVSKGNLLGLENLQAAVSAGTNVTITWDAVAELGEVKALERANDYGSIVIYNETTDRFFLNSHGVKRSAGTQPIHLPKAYAGAKLHVYFFFVREDGKAASTSQYLGSFTGIA